MSRALPPVGVRAVLKDVVRDRCGLAGLIMISAVLLAALLAPLLAPYDVAKQWSNPTAWEDNPALAAPSWVNLITGVNLPETIKVDKFHETITFAGATDQRVKIIHMVSEPFSYRYDDFPSELKCVVSVKYVDAPPYVRIYVERPDGVRVPLFSGHVGESRGPALRVVKISMSYDERVRSLVREFLASRGTTLSSISVEQVVFSRGLSSDVLKGDYRIYVEAEAYSPYDDVNVTFLALGKVHGLFGTDDHRRDIALGVLWGASVSLAFGVVAGVLTVLVEAFVGSLGAWWGRRADEVVQRLADVFLVLPVFPILILISFLYKVTIWMLLGIVILFGVLGGITKVVRPLVMQIASEQYVEAAVSYGAGKMRILIRYIMPRLLPYLFMNISLSVPSFIFLEAALCILGLGDPELPTWGRILEQAWHGGAIFHGYWWWILTPALAISWTAIGFALLGYAFDRVTNPRLREY